MSPHGVVFAIDWQEKWTEYQETAVEFLQQNVPQLPTMPDMPIPAYVALSFAGLLLLIALFRLLTLRIFRSFFTLIAVVLMAYYPVAYGVHYGLFKYQERIEAAELEPPDWLNKAFANLRYIDWGILGGGVVIGLLIFSMTLGGSRRKRGADVDEEEVEEAPQPVQQPQRRGRQQPQQRRPPQRDPFDFS